MSEPPGYCDECGSALKMGVCRNCMNRERERPSMDEQQLLELLRRGYTLRLNDQGHIEAKPPHSATKDIEEQINDAIRDIARMQEEAMKNLSPDLNSTGDIPERTIEGIPMNPEEPNPLSDQQKRDFR